LNGTVEIERRESFMKRSWWLAFAVAATMLGLPGPRGLAQEPAKGRFSIELGFTSKGLMLKIGGGLALPDTPTVIDTVCPTIVPAYVQMLVQRVKNAIAPPVGMTGGLSDFDRDKQATQLFEVGEIYRRTGQYASARTYFSRVHQSAPTSRLGRLAIDRLGELDDRLREAEESSEIDPEALFDRMIERTIPLGLVRQETY